MTNGKQEYVILQNGNVIGGGFPSFLSASYAANSIKGAAIGLVLANGTLKVWS